MKKKIQIIQYIGIVLLFLVLVGAYFLVNKFSFFKEKHNEEVSFENSYFTENQEDSDMFFAFADSLPTESKNLHNAEILFPFFEKLSLLDSLKDRKINILHIGDSHVQADIMTHTVRQKFQEQFGNAGLGFVFPYSIIKTNGGTNVRFSSNIQWGSQKNFDAKKGISAGLGGYSLYTSSQKFAIELQVKNPEYAFNTLKIITPENQHFFNLATSKGEVKIKPSVVKSVTHKVKKGETLYAIAKKYHTTVAKIQQINKLKGTNIRIGSTLKISTSEVVTKNVELNNFEVFGESNSSFSYYMYENLEVSDKIFLTPNLPNSEFSLNGIVLENDKNGVIYHSIGINGGHFSDFNQNKLFFDQIKALEPDLIIVSLGTNESFGRLSSEKFWMQTSLFIESVREKYAHCPILFTTPPPSQFKRKVTNPFPNEYTNILINNSLPNKYSVFDLYNAVGGNQAINRLVSQHMIAKDRVHYSKKGYQEHGELLFESLISHYFRVKKRPKVKGKNTI